MAYEHLWNDLTFDERKRLSPWQMENHILHLEQTRSMITVAHMALLRKIDSQIANIQHDLLGHRHRRLSTKPTRPDETTIKENP
jgi:hypothetical protein